MFFNFFFYFLYLEGGEQPSPSLSGTTEQDPCRHSWAALSGNRIYGVHTHQHQLHTPHPPCESSGTQCPFPCQTQELVWQRVTAPHLGQCEGHVNQRCCLSAIQETEKRQGAAGHRWEGSWRPACSSVRSQPGSGCPAGRHSLKMFVPELQGSG